MVRHEPAYRQNTPVGAAGRPFVQYTELQPNRPETHPGANCMSDRNVASRPWVFSASGVVAICTAALWVCDCLPTTSADQTTADATETAAKPLQSGLKVGEKVVSFYVRAVTGPLKNKSVCYICRYGDRPVVMVVVRKITPELKALLKRIDAEIDQQRGAGLRGFGVFISEESQTLLPRVQTLAFDGGIELPLTIAAAPADGSAAGAIHSDAAVTVMLYRDLTVTANFAYRANELNQTEIERVISAVRRLAAED
jgi:hypothetical protein